MSKLTNTEKFACQGMRHAGKSVEEMAKQLNRPEHVIKRYVEGELEAIIETIAKAQIQQANQAKIENPENKPIKSKDLFVRETISKKENVVAISTEAASSRGDAANKKSSLVSRHANKNIYRISDGKILQHGDNLKGK
jgi:hypothetical protein